MIRTRLLFEVSVTSLLLASSAAALRSNALPVVLVEKRGSIQNAIDVVELQREPGQPRAIWMDNTLNRRKAESCEQRYYAGRKLADDIGVVSLIWAQRATTDGRDISADFYVVDFWKRSGGDWQIIPRYSSPVGKPPDRPSRHLPPASDSDPQLTDLLRQLEQKF